MGASAARMLDDARARNLAGHEVPSLGEHLVKPVVVDEHERWHLDRWKHGPDVRVQVARELRRETTGRDRGSRVAGEPFSLQTVRGVPPLLRPPRVADGLDLLLPAF